MRLGQIDGAAPVIDKLRENGVLYAVCEQVDGVPVREVCAERGGRLSFEEALSLLAPVLDALCEIARRGCWHGEVCPENIVVRRMAVHAVLLGFGMSAPHGWSSDPHWSPEGYVLPEFYCDHRPFGPYGSESGEDTYDFCSTLFYLITGSNPKCAREEESGRRRVRRPDALRPYPKAADLIMGVLNEGQRTDRPNKRIMPMEAFARELLHALDFPVRETAEKTLETWYAETWLHVWAFDTM